MLLCNKKAQFIVNRDKKRVLMVLKCTKDFVSFKKQIGVSKYTCYLNVITKLDLKSIKHFSFFLSFF